nr:MAG TPA: hypothetical protein [Caudoviricetes sp.]
MYIMLLWSVYICLYDVLLFMIRRESGSWENIIRGLML